MRNIMLAMIATKNLALNILALYGVIIIFSWIWLLPVLLGWDPEVNGVTQNFDIDGLFSIDILGIHLTCVVLTIWVGFKGFFPVLSMIKNVVVTEADGNNS